MSGRLRLLLVGLTLGALALWGAVVVACSVPVFRYALERWPADPYAVVLFRRGAQGEDERSSPKGLPALFAEAQFANVRVLTVDLEGEVSAGAREFWKSLGEPEPPHLAVLYPRQPGGNHVLWSGRPSEAPVSAILDSPVRREIARRILKGDSAVWVLLESGDAAKDDAAAALLAKELKRMEETLELPPQAEAQIGPGPELHVAFSVLRVTRSDAAERMLVKMLLDSEPDLGDLSDPMAFPVFGRGRVLWALVGKGINAENIERTCWYLVGPCSCQVKYQNPGTDLLMSVDWDGLIFGEAVIDEALPPLVGLPEPDAPPAATEDDPEQPVAGPSDVADVSDPADVPGVSAVPKAGQGDRGTGAGGALVRNVVIAGALALFGVAIATVLMKRRSRRRGS